MRILHVVRDLEFSSGGPSRSVPQLARSLQDIGVNSAILAGDYSNENVHKDKDNGEIDVLRLPMNKRLHLGLSSKVRSHMRSFPRVDLVHIHGIWSGISHSACSLARRENIPYLISPRGMLEPWALQHKRWKKKLAMRLYQWQDLKSAKLLHATSSQEKTSLDKLGLGINVEVVTNGTETPDCWKDASTFGTKRALFLSRLHPVKGIEILIGAWANIRPMGWSCLIVGPGDSDYRAMLSRMISSLGLDDCIQIKEGVVDEEKWALMRSADLFVLPSHSENFGMAIAEALASGVPVITTKCTPWEEILHENCGWYIDDDRSSLEAALKEAIHTGLDELALMGQRGRELILRKYNWCAVARQMRDLYSRVLSEVKKPSDS